MAVVSGAVLQACDGFCVEKDGHAVGWVEETWLGLGDEPAALALRLLDGRRGLLLAGDVADVLSEREYVRVREGARLLELGAPHVVAEGAASWEVTGAVVEPSEAEIQDEAALELRPWRLRPAHTSVFRTIGLMLSALAVLIGIEIAAAFVIAYLVTGRAY